MDTLSLGIIIGSTRPDRFSEQPANWIFAKAKNNPSFAPELLDLRDYPLPFYDEPKTPKEIKGEYQNETARRWVAKVKAMDAFIIVAPEYNHGYSAVLKNALDYPYAEWNNKPVGFVSYGGVGGARSVEQMRLVAIELQMAPIREAVHMVNYWKMLDEQGKIKTETFEESGDRMLTQLAWWGHALKNART